MRLHMPLHHKSECCVGTAHSNALRTAASFHCMQIHRRSWSKVRLTGLGARSSVLILLQGWCLEACKAKANEIMAAAETVHPEAVTRVVIVLLLLNHCHEPLQ